MSTEVLTPEEAPDLEAMPRANLPAIWDGFREKAAKLETTAKTLVVTDVSQLTEMRLARATRLGLREIRLEVEARRKELVEDFLRKQQGINAAAKAIKDYIEPMEERLLEQEKFIERFEAKRRTEMIATRTAQVLEYLRNPSHYNLAELSGEEFAALLAGFAAMDTAKKEADKRAADELAAKQRAEAEERERLKQEAARLRQEAEAREAKARQEREEALAKAREAAEVARREKEALETQARLEREAAAKREADIAEKARVEREKFEAEVRAQREAREKIEEADRQRVAADAASKKAAEAAAAKAKRAPEKVKLRAFCASLYNIELPDLESPEAKAIGLEIAQRISALVEFINSKAEGL